MNNRLAYLVLPLFIACSVRAQITVKTTSIPQIGDTLYTMVDNLPQMINPGQAGGNQTWDFTNLSGPFVRKTVFLPASEGTASDRFPAANAVTLPNASIENYYAISGDQISEVGVYGMDPTGLGMDISGHYSDPLLIKRAPLIYGAENQLQTDLSFPIDPEDLPDTLVDMIPMQFDSVRLKVEINRTDKVDAWGQLNLPDEQAQVLREKRVEERNGRIEVLVALGWFDVTDFIIGQLPLQIPQTDTIVNFFYFDETSIEPMAMLTVDSTGNVSRVEYKASEATDVKAPDASHPDVVVYPNPSFGEVRFEMIGLPSGVYKLQVMNILGVSIWGNEYFVNGRKIVPVDLTELQRGTYFYRLVDQNDHTIVTKRLVLIRP